MDQQAPRDSAVGHEPQGIRGRQHSVIPDRGFAGLTRARLRTPLIAVVEGWALGGESEMALARDLIVAAEDAAFGLPEATSA
ncbi:enoyl-CoA hydratase-related protein [Saccharopolyspora sp. NPDC000995]